VLPPLAEEAAEGEAATLGDPGIALRRELAGKGKGGKKKGRKG